MDNNAPKAELSDLDRETLDRLIKMRDTLVNISGNLRELLFQMETSMKQNAEIEADGVLQRLKDKKLEWRLELNLCESTLIQRGSVRTNIAAFYF